MAEGKLLDIPEEPLPTKNQGERILHTKKIPVLDSSGNPQFLLGISEDITDQKRQQEMEMYTKALEVSNREMQDFVFVASHDLQEPLRKIQSFGQFLRDEFKEVLGEAGKDYVERMQSAASRMQILINDLLALTRVTTKAQPFVKVDLSKVVQEVLVDLETRIAEKKAQVLVESLPVVDADATQMRQLFQNLIANALKFQKVGVPPEIKVSSAAAGGQCRILVQDNGIGFDNKYGDQIFKVFERLHGRDEYEGTGIGLAICRKVVERHHGTIKAEGILGKGSTFTITLPLQQQKR
jgi:light-regulated signal transduction histidine kinase (bacteriophytochrome)